MIRRIAIIAAMLLAGCATPRPPSDGPVAAGAYTRPAISIGSKGELAVVAEVGDMDGVSLWTWTGRAWTGSQIATASVATAKRCYTPDVANGIADVTIEAGGGGITSLVSELQYGTIPQEAAISDGAATLPVLPALEGFLRMKDYGTYREYVGFVPFRMDGSTNYAVSNMYGSATLYGGDGPWDVDNCDTMNYVITNGAGGHAVVDYEYYDDETGEQWRDTSGNPVGTVAIPPGTFFRYKRKPANTNEYITICGDTQRDPYTFAIKGITTNLVISGVGTLQFVDGTLRAVIP